MLVDSCSFVFGRNSDFDILMKHDTTIPASEAWSLLGPTKVGVIRNASSDLALEVEGRLLAHGTDSDTTQVTFRSAESSPGLGDWQTPRSARFGTARSTKPCWESRWTR